MKKNRPDIDVAFSVSKKDSGYAKRLNDIIKGRGYRTFFYLDNEWSVYLSGRDPDTEFGNIFGPRSLLVAPITSKHYIASRACKYELSVAIAEEDKRGSQHILHMPLDDTKVFRLSGSELYVPLNDDNLPEKAELLIDKIKELKELQRGKIKSAEIILKKSRFDNNELDAIGLLATSAFDFSIDELVRLTPNFSWKVAIRKLRKKGLVVLDNHKLHLDDNFILYISTDKDKSTSYHKIWIELLSDIWYSSDVAILMFSHLSAINNFNAGVRVLVDVSNSLEPGYWNEIYLKLLSNIYNSKLYNKLNTEIKNELLNALGICLIRAIKYNESDIIFKKLYNRALRKKDDFWIGQVYIYRGLSYYERNDDKNAEYYYRKAEVIARKLTDKSLLSKVVNNIASMLIGKNDSEANRLMEEAMNLKRKIKDYRGIAGAYLGFGNLAARRKDFKEAQRLYNIAIRIAIKYDLRYLHALILINLGNVHYEKDELDEARKLYIEAKDMSIKEGFLGSEKMAVNGEAQTLAKLEDYEKAEKLFLELEQSCIKLKDYIGRYQALMNAGVSRIKQKSFVNSRSLFRKGLRLSKKSKNQQWIFNFQLYLALSYREEGRDKETVGKIRTYANEEEKMGNSIVAGKLFRELAEQLVLRGALAKTVINAYEKSITLLKKEKTAASELITTYKQLFLYLRENRIFDQALEVLSAFTKLAEKIDCLEELATALDEHGVLLQNLGRLDEAEKLHLESLKISRKLTWNRQLIINLNNLGELYRKLGRLEKAVECFDEVISLSKKLKDISSEISTLHNKALALESLGKIQEAESTLISCKNRAQRNKLEYEYVRALLGLANLAYSSENYKLATKRYLNVIRISKGFSQLQLQAIMNYSELLILEDKAKDALNLMVSNYELFINCTYSMDYNLILHKVYMKLNDIKMAFDHIKSAFLISLKDNNLIYLEETIMIMYDLVDNNYINMQINELLGSIQINKYDDKIKILIMKLLTMVNVILGNEKIANNYYVKAIKLCKKRNLIDVQIDIFMQLGDIYYKKGKRRMYKAFQSYISGYALSFGIDVDMTPFIVATHHIIKTLIHLNGIYSEYSSALKVRLEKWLDKQIKEIDRKDELMRFMLMPFYIVEDLENITKDPKNPTALEITHAFESVMKNLSAESN